MIYLEPDAQEKCITLFHYALNEGGFLFLGNAETVGKKSRLFQSIGHKQCRVYRKLETKPASRLPISVPYAAERSAQQASKQAQLAEQRRSFTEIVQEKLLEEYAPASVAIDQNYEIIYHNGPTNKYLLQPRGVPTQNLLELLPENLRSRIRGALYRSSHEGKTVSIRASLPVAGENPPRSPLSKGGSKIIPPLAKGGRGDLQPVRQISLRITKAAENLFIVVFQEKGVALQGGCRRAGRCHRHRGDRDPSARRRTLGHTPGSSEPHRTAQEPERGAPVLERGIAGRERGA